MINNLESGSEPALIMGRHEDGDGMEGFTEVVRYYMELTGSGLMLMTTRVKLSGRLILYSGSSVSLTYESPVPDALVSTSLSVHVKFVMFWFSPGNLDAFQTVPKSICGAFHRTRGPRQRTA